MPYEPQSKGILRSDERARHLEAQRLEEAGQYIKDVFGPITAAKTPNEKYGAMLNAIRHGFYLLCEERARELARAHNIDTKDLPEAVKQGEHRVLLSYAKAIINGHEHVRENAEELATKLGQDLGELVETIIINSVPF